MTDFKTLVRTRRSHRKYTDEEVSAEDVKDVVRAALMAPTSKSTRAWHFIVVDNPMTIEKLADAKEHGSQFLKQAPVAIVLAAHEQDTDCWIEDLSIAAVTMQYQAEELGLGTCWAQMRGRSLADGTSAELVCRGILNLPDDMRVLCVLSLGHPADERKPQDEDNLKWENVHVNGWVE